jgi:hypothetical protein
MTFQICFHVLKTRKSHFFSPSFDGGVTTSLNKTGAASLATNFRLKLTIYTSSQANCQTQAFKRLKHEISIPQQAANSGKKVNLSENGRF